VRPGDIGDDYIPECQTCGGPQSKNPHPEAGKPNTEPWPGYQWECIPCLVKRSFARYDRLLALERDYAWAVETLKDAIAWMDPDGCDCGTDEPGTCALCMAEEIVKKWKGQRDEIV
jgi:hypothetical protein